jgi:hypothetical protein
VAIVLGEVVLGGVWVRIAKTAYVESTSIKTQGMNKERRAVREPPSLRGTNGALPANHICVVNDGVVPQNQPLL